MATASATADVPAAPKSGKKKLIVLVAAALLVVAAGGGGALFFLKKRASADEDGGEDTHAVAEHDPKVAPTFVPLDPFTVNLADKDVERYAQIGVTFAVADAHVVDSIKQFMPAIRNNILMVLAHKTSAELLVREGKDSLATEIQRETSRALGVDVDDDVDEHADEDKPTKKKRKKRAPAPLPVSAVYFSNFIVQ